MASVMPLKHGAKEPAIPKTISLYKFGSDIKSVNATPLFMEGKNRRLKKTEGQFYSISIFKRRFKLLKS